MFQRFRDRLPPVLHQFRRVPRIDPLADHFIKRQHRARLQHAAQNGLLAHQITFDFRHKTGMQHTGVVAAGRHRVRLRLVQSFSFGVVFGVYLRAKEWN